MNVDVYCCTWNEERILPWFLDHYSFARRVYIYDQSSTDRSREIAATYGNVEIRDFHSDGFDEDAIIGIKNNAWRGSDADWVIVCDADELLYHRDVVGELGRLHDRGVTYPVVTGFEMVGKKGLPEYDGSPLTKHIYVGHYSKLYSKQVVFDPRKVDQHYHWGCHSCEPKGEIVRGGNLKLLHMNFLGVTYIMDRWARLRDRTPPDAVVKGQKAYDWEEQTLKQHHWEKLVISTRVV